MTAERRVWQRIGARCYDRGQFISIVITPDGNTRVGKIVWRKGKWIPDPDCKQQYEQHQRKKAQQTKQAEGKPLAEEQPTEEERKTGSKGHEYETFIFFGQGYKDYECTEVLYGEEEFAGIQ
jgi:hypothetical protein